MKYDIKILSPSQMDRCLICANKVFNKIRCDEKSDDLAMALAENSCLCFMSTYKNSKRYYKSPYDVLKKLSIQELCNFYEDYKKLYETYKGGEINV